MKFLPSVLFKRSTKKAKYSRLYVDLIFTHFGKYPALDPGKPIAPGNYGFIDGDSGEFIVKGDIFEENLADTNIIVHCPAEQDFSYETTVAKVLAFQPEAGMNVAGLAECSFKKRWRIGKAPCAALSLIAPRTSYLKETDVLFAVMQSKALRDYALVTEVVTCTAFAYLVHNEEKTEISLGFKASVPLASVVGPSAGFEGEWIQSGSASMVRTGVINVEEAHGARYVPLYTLKAFRPKELGVRRLRMKGPDVISEHVGHGAAESEDGTSVDIGCSVLEGVVPPWGDLDSDGETVDEE